MQKYNILLRASKAIWLLLHEQKAKRVNSAEPDQGPELQCLLRVKEDLS